MKKQLLFIAALFAVIGLNAQDWDSVPVQNFSFEIPDDGSKLKNFALVPYWNCDYVDEAEATSDDSGREKSGSAPAGSYNGFKCNYKAGSHNVYQWVDTLNNGSLTDQDTIEYNIGTFVKKTGGGAGVVSGYYFVWYLSTFDVGGDTSVRAVQDSAFIEFAPTADWTEFDDVVKVGYQANKVVVIEWNFLTPGETNNTWFGIDSITLKNRIKLSSSSFSDNAYLSSLSADKGTLEPAFDSSIFNYTLTLYDSVKQITISALESDDAATATGTGTIDLVGVDQTIDIVVTAEDGTKLTYSIDINLIPVPGWSNVNVKNHSFEEPDDGVKYKNFEVIPGWNCDYADAAERDKDDSGREKKNPLDGTYRGYKAGHLGHSIYQMIDTLNDNTLSETDVINYRISSGATIGYFPTEAPESGYLVWYLTSYSVGGDSTVRHIEDSAAIELFKSESDTWSSFDEILKVGYEANKVIAIEWNVIVPGYTGNSWFGIDNIIVQKSISDSSKPELSNDAALSSLSVDKGSLSPAFDAGVYSYTLTVDDTVSQVTISAEANHDSATFAGGGTTDITGEGQAIDIVVTAEDGTQLTYSISIALTKTVTSVNQHSDEAVAVYPNPASKFITVQANMNSNISIYNNIGQLMLNVIADETEELIDISSYKPGIYILVLNNGVQNQTVSFIKE